MKHGVKIDMIPSKYGGTGAIKIDDEVLPYLFDDEKLYWKISKPTQDDMDVLRWFELTPPNILGETRIRRQSKKALMPHGIPWEEWQRRLGMLPEDVVKRTVLDATTQLYMEIENENRSEPREHLPKCMPRSSKFSTTRNGGI